MAVSLLQLTMLKHTGDLASIHSWQGLESALNLT